MSVTVSVRSPGKQSVVVNVDSAGTVADVKAAISKSLGLDFDGFHVVFLGKYLNEATEIKDLELGRNSVLHALPTGKAVTATSAKVSREARYYYYVYCRLCDKLQAGKLRVRCTDCGEGAIVLDQEPGCWEDVLVSRLHGSCGICDSQTFAQFYFKCYEHDDESAIPLRYIRPNSRSVECVTCADIQSPVLVYPCLDKHVMCLDCFISYCTVSLNNKNFLQHPDVGYTLPCPAGCLDSCIYDIHHFHLLGKEQYERYKDFGAEECLLQTGGMICPNRGCGEGIIVDETVTTVKCSTCWHEFCRQCREAVHPGDCIQNPAGQLQSQMNPVDADRAMRARWDTQSVDTIQKTTKACPNCQTRTERDGGCMHMKCSRCRQDWCWLCEKVWDRSCQGDHWFG